MPCHPTLPGEFSPRYHYQRIRREFVALTAGESQGKLEIATAFPRLLPRLQIVIHQLIVPNSDALVILDAK